MLDFRVKLAFKSQFTIRLREDYRLTLLPERGQLVLAGPGIDHQRPCPVDNSETVKIQIFVEGSLIECFVNDQFAQTGKAPRSSEG